MKTVLLSLAILSSSITLYGQTLTWSMEQGSNDPVNHYFIDGVEVDPSSEMATILEENKGLKLIDLPYDAATKEGTIDLFYLVEKGTWYYFLTANTEMGVTYTAKQIEGIDDHLVVYDAESVPTLFIQGKSFADTGKRRRTVNVDYYFGSNTTGALLKYPGRSKTTTFHKPEEMRGMWVCNVDGQHFYFVIDGEFSVNATDWTKKFEDGNYHIETGAGKKYILKNIQSIPQKEWTQGEEVE